MELALTLALAGAAAFALMDTAAVAQQAPKFEIDTSWPKPLPNNWIFGQIGGIFVDKDDNVWISQRPRTSSSTRRATWSRPGAGRKPPRAMTGRKTSTACLSTTRAMSGSEAMAR